LPELILLITTLLTSAFSAGFEWLYPVRVVATACALAYLWKHFNFKQLSIQAVPVLIGVGVFFLWIVLVPPSVDKSREFSAGLASVSSVAALGWIVIRVIGTTFIVPLAEELAFRGYLINVLSKNPAPGDKPYVFAWLPLIASSIFFGALHSQWIAGVLAGVAFGLARYFRGKIWDAVIAHMVANGLLAAYVLTTQQWSYW
jgi:CAAX prenyl protease-like protein